MEMPELGLENQAVLMEKNLLQTKTTIHKLKLEKGLVRLNTAGNTLLMGGTVLLTLSAGYLSIANHSLGYGVTALLGGCATAFLVTQIQKEKEVLKRQKSMLEELSMSKKDDMIEPAQLVDGLRQMKIEERKKERIRSTEISQVGIWSIAELFLLSSVIQNPTLITAIFAGFIPCAIIDHVARLSIYQNSISELKKEKKYWYNQLPVEEQDKIKIK